MDTTVENNVSCYSADNHLQDESDHQGEPDYTNPTDESGVTKDIIDSFDNSILISVRVPDFNSMSISCDNIARLDKLAKCIINKYGYSKLRVYFLSSCSHFLQREFKDCNTVTSAFNLISDCIAHTFPCLCSNDSHLHACGAKAITVFYYYVNNVVFSCNLANNQVMPLRSFEIDNEYIKSYRDFSVYFSYFMNLSTRIYNAMIKPELSTTTGNNIEKDKEKRSFIEAYTSVYKSTLCSARPAIENTVSYLYNKKQSSYVNLYSSFSLYYNNIVSGICNSNSYYLSWRIAPIIISYGTYADSLRKFNTYITSFDFFNVINVSKLYRLIDDKYGTMLHIDSVSNNGEFHSLINYYSDYKYDELPSSRCMMSANCIGSYNELTDFLVNNEVNGTLRMKFLCGITLDTYEHKVKNFHRQCTLMMRSPQSGDSSNIKYADRAPMIDLYRYPNTLHEVRSSLVTVANNNLSMSDIVHKSCDIVMHQSGHEARSLPVEYLSNMKFLVSVYLIIWTGRPL